MRVWLVQTGEELPLDGPHTRLLRTALLAEELVQRGHEVIYINATFNHQRKLQRAKGTQIVPRDPAAGRNYDCVLLAGRAYASNVSFNRFRSHRENAAAFKQVANGLPKPDLILCGFPPIELAKATADFARENGIPLAVDCRDMWPEVIEERLPWVARPLGRIALTGLYHQKKRALAGADALTGITDAFVSWGQRSAGRLPRAADQAFHLTVSPSNIAADALAQGRGTWRTLIGNQQQSAVLTGCLAGTFATRTDILTIIDGANGLTQDERSRVRIILCGKGDLTQQMAERASGNPAIVIAGWRNAAEIAALMERSDFGLLPYLNTPDFLASYPNKVGEYLLAGLPIMTGLQGVTGTLLDGEGLALRYSLGEASSVTRLLRELLDNPIDQEMRSRARAVGQMHFDPRRIYPAFADWLESLARTGPGLTPSTSESLAA